MTAIFMIAPDGLSCFFHIYKFIAVNRDRRAFLWKSFRQEIRLALGKMWLARANMTFQPVLEGCVGFIFHSLCVDDYLGNTPGGCWADQVERGLEVLSTAGAPRKVETEKSFCAFFRNCMRGNREWKIKSWDLGYLGGRVYWFSMRNGWLTPQMIAPGWEQVQRDQSPELNPQGNSRWISHLWCSRFPLSYATEGDIPYSGESAGDTLDLTSTSKRPGWRWVLWNGQQESGAYIVVTLTDNALRSGEILLLLTSTVFVGQRRHTNLVQGWGGGSDILRLWETLQMKIQIWRAKGPVVRYQV